MLGVHICFQCMAALQTEDGRDLCLPCLGVDHLKEALSNLYTNCSFMPLSLRNECLAAVDSTQAEDALPPSGVGYSSRSSFS